MRTFFCSLQKSNLKATELDMLKFIFMKFVVPYTRQQLTSVTGLYVETVIKVVKKLELSGKIFILNRKV